MAGLVDQVEGGAAVDEQPSAQEQLEVERDRLRAANALALKDLPRGFHPPGLDDVDPIVAQDLIEHAWEVCMGTKLAAGGMAARCPGTGSTALVTQEAVDFAHKWGKSVEWVVNNVERFKGAT